MPERCPTRTTTSTPRASRSTPSPRQPAASSSRWTCSTSWSRAHAAYFHRQVAWLQDRFPTAELEAVPGLVKLVDRQEIAAADWSLTPGRYVGVAPPEEDEGFDFEQALRDIHTELADLNREAAELAAKIQKNFEELGV